MLPLLVFACCLMLVICNQAEAQQRGMGKMSPWLRQLARQEGGLPKKAGAHVASHSSNTDEISNKSLFHFAICSAKGPLNGDKSNCCTSIISVSSSLFISFQFAIVGK